MSTATAPARPAPDEPLSGRNELRIVSHSNLFYWWPVWAVGFIMAIITHFNGHKMVVVPDDTVVAHRVNKLDIPNEGNEKINPDLQGQDVLVPPPKTELQTPRLRMASNKNLGIIFCTILLLVIAITNIPLRGLWSVIVIITAIFLVIIFSLMGWWDRVIEAIHYLDIRINEAGYLVISSVLFVMWVISLFLFDQQIYMVFTPGQLRVRLEIGEGETAYDTSGMTIQKQRSDLFRHWILGLGSGDLIVNTAGAQVHHFDLPNVLFVGRKVREIEQMLRAKPVVRAPG